MLPQGIPESSSVASEEGEEEESEDEDRASSSSSSSCSESLLSRSYCHALRVRLLLQVVFFVLAAIQYVISKPLPLPGPPRHRLGSLEAAEIGEQTLGLQMIPILQTVKGRKETCWSIFGAVVLWAPALLLILLLIV